MELKELIEATIKDLQQGIHTINTEIDTLRRKVRAKQERLGEWKQKLEEIDT